MVDRLAEAQEWDLLAISQLLGGLAFKQKPEQEWFRKRFTMYQDILRESWVYQEIGQQFHEQGLEEGQRQTIVNFLKVRFPEITSLATQQINSIKDPEGLNALSLKLFAAQTVEEARQALLEVNKQ